MSDLRFFADTMHDLLARERRLSQIAANAARYSEACKEIRQQNLPRGDCISPAFHKANEGLCSVRIIFEGSAP